MISASRRIGIPCFFILITVFRPHTGLSQEHNPIADPAAIVISSQVRFTILTSQLVRMEWSENETFEDAASLLFINRRLPVPHFQKRTEGDWLVIETGKLTLRYKPESGRLSADNLSIAIRAGHKEIIWHPGMPDTANLGGTIRTLDGVEKPVSLEPGILSRDGWVVVDDSERPLLDASDWPWVKPRSPGNRQDLYFFGYGHEYRHALHDFTLVAGKIPMPPRFAFGLWWSRYWAYTDQELKALVHEFETHGVPLDVLVIDMDWHQTFNLRWDTDKRDQAGQRLGWTGYSWDPNYFPNPSAFLEWCERKGLKTPLNLHPASGIQPHEETYPAMARAMGIDPASKAYVPFDIVDKRFAANYMNIVIRPLEQQGVDFWWLDWQQWSTTKIPGVTPTWWLNYVFFTDMGRKNGPRPLLFHRWGGLGNHRYQIGFSGDAISNWDVLQFETYFTATASNVGFGYWSHDIGGHIPGPVSPELYTRWIQFGAFSPILRTHTTKNPKAERRIWGYPNEYYDPMREAVLLRYSLIPYIYTAARETYDSGSSICTPLYHRYPEIPAAYEFKYEYMFGEALLVAPIAQPIDTLTMLASQRIWLPEGTWYEWFTGTRLQGPAIFKRQFALAEIPLYARAGAIIPMQPEMRNTHEKSVDPLLLTIFPGDSGSTVLYEDDGATSGYQRGEHARTGVRFQSDTEDLTVEVLPVLGSYPGMLEERSLEIRLPGTLPPKSVRCNGKSIEYSSETTVPHWSYDGDRVTTFIRTPRMRTNERVEVKVLFPKAVQNASSLLDGVPGKLARLKHITPLLNSTWPKEWSPDVLVDAAQTGNRITLRPDKAERELGELAGKISEAMRTIALLKVDSTIVAKVLGHLTRLP